MKRNIFRKTLFIAVFSVFSTFPVMAGGNPTFDYSFLGKFWDIAGIYMKDGEVDGRYWGELYQQSGYKKGRGQLMIDRHRYEKNIRLVFKPSCAEELKRELARGDLERRRVLNHLIKVKNNRQEVDRFMEWLRKNPIMDTAIERAFEYLPPKKAMKRKFKIPPVIFAFFSNEANSGVSIMFDACYAWELGPECFMLVMAHELHHYYYRCFQDYNIRNIPRGQNVMIATLTTIQMEGMADLVDKKTLFAKKRNANPYISTYYEKLQFWKRKCPRIIRSMDKLLIMTHRNPGKSVEYGRLFSSLLPMNGHCIGQYMVAPIMKVYGKEELIKVTGNPFAFVRLYSKSAEKLGGGIPAFSRESIDFLSSLEEECGREPDVSRQPEDPWEGFLRIWRMGEGIWNDALRNVRIIVPFLPERGPSFLPAQQG